MADADWIFAPAPDTFGPVTARDGHGDLPTGLRGRLLRNGPGRQRLGDRALHFFDGDGFLAVAELDGELRVRGRVVDGSHSAAEVAAGRQLARRPFTNLPGRWSNFLAANLANPHNHDAVGWGDRVLACDAPGWKAFDATLQPVDQPVRARAPASLAPMPRPDPIRDRLAVYQVSPGLRGDRLHVLEVDRAWTVHRVTDVALPERGGVLHDAVATERFHVVACFGRLSLPGVLWGATAAIEHIDFDRTTGLPLYVVARDGSAVHTVRLPAGMQAFHLFNAFERGAEVVIDAVLYEGRVDFRALYPPGFAGAPPPDPLAGPFPTRISFDPATGATTFTRQDGIFAEAPEVDGRRHGRPTRWGFGAARASRGDEPLDTAYFWFHGVGRVDFEGSAHALWDAGPRVFCSPPAFAPRGEGEADGWLLCWLHDAAADRAGVAVLDAANLESGPIATRWLDRALPGVSHVSWWA